MIEINGNMWDIPADAHMVTTNGTINEKTGRAVMGGGCAREAVELVPSIDKRFAEILKGIGHQVSLLALCVEHSVSEIWSFPVKYEVWKDAELELIESSAKQCNITFADYDKVIIPRPGCGLGNLSWDQVKPVIEPHLDDRFYIIDF